MIRALRASVLAFAIARSRDFIDINRDKPRRAPTTDVPPPDETEFDYVEGPINPLLHYRSFTLLKPDENITGPASLRDELNGLSLTI